jgi:predicted DNA-binding protein (MmcQ/YjbR family)
MVMAAAALAEGGVILVGERLATVPGALSAAVALAEHTGARLAWVPRRAGERGALEAGAFPTLLPGGRLVTDASARAEVALAWDLAGLPDTPGRDSAGIVAALRSGELDGVVIGGVDPFDLGIGDADAVLGGAFVVSLEQRPSAATAYADVILPVATVAEKIYCFLGESSIGVKCGSTRAEADEWLAEFPADASVMPYLGRSGWNTLRIDGAIGAEVLKEAIDASYALVVARLPRSRRPSGTGAGGG